MYEYIEKDKEIKYIRQYQTELTEIKNIITDLKNALDFNIRLYTAEEWKSELEDKAFVIHTNSNNIKSYKK